MSNNFDVIKYALINNMVLITQSDTVLAIMTIMGNQKGMDRIYEIKKRNKECKFSILNSDLEMVKRYAIVKEREEKILKKDLPGYYTFILEAREDVVSTISKDLISEKDNIRKIGIRIPNSEFLIRLIREIGSPIVATSANISGKDVATKIEEIEGSIKNSVDFVIDSKIIITNKSSTVIDLTNDKFEVIRP